MQDLTAVIEEMRETFTDAFWKEHGIYAHSFDEFLEKAKDGLRPDQLTVKELRSALIDFTEFDYPADAVAAADKLNAANRQPS